MVTSQIRDATHIVTSMTTELDDPNAKNSLVTLKHRTTCTIKND